MCFTTMQFIVSISTLTEMAKHFWFKFEWTKWRNDPQLRLCSKETRGFWIDCIAAMEELDTHFLKGTPDEICRIVVCTMDEFKRSIAELQRTKAATITKNQGCVKIVSRKILKDVNLTEYNRLKKRESRRRQRVKKPSNNSSKDIEIKSLKVKESLNTVVGNVETPQAATKRGSRLPEPFFLTAKMREYAATKRPKVDVKEETEKFVNYYRAKTGRDATKLDWLATWRNWILNAKDGISRNGTNQRPTSERDKQAERTRDAKAREEELMRIGLEKRRAEEEAGRGVSGGNDANGPIDLGTGEPAALIG